MTLTGVLAMGRRFAEGRMTETLAIGTVAAVTDPVTYEVESVLTPVYAGVGRVKFPSVNESEVAPGGQLVVTRDLEVHLPSGMTGVLPGMVVVVQASAVDSALVGRTFRVKGRPGGGQTTAARFAVEDAGEVVTVES